MHKIWTTTTTTKVAHIKIHGLSYRAAGNKQLPFLWNHPHIVRLSVVCSWLGVLYQLLQVGISFWIARTGKMSTSLSFQKLRKYLENIDTSINCCQWTTIGSFTSVSFGVKIHILCQTLIGFYLYWKNVFLFLKKTHFNRLSLCRRRNRQSNHSFCTSFVICAVCLSKFETLKTSINQFVGGSLKSHK